MSATPADFTTLQSKAAGGNAIAQYNLGIAYAQGEDTPIDLVSAFVWLSAAADRGTTGRALLVVREKMTPEQRAEAEKILARRRAADPTPVERPQSQSTAKAGPNPIATESRSSPPQSSNTKSSKPDSAPSRESNDASSLSREREQLSNELALAWRDLGFYENNLRTTAAELNLVKARLAVSDGRAGEAQVAAAQLAGLRQQNQTLLAEQATLTKEKLRAMERAAHFSTENAALTARATQAEDALRGADTTTSRLTEITNALALAQRDSTAAQRDLATERSNVTELRTSLNQIRAELAESSATVAELQSKFSAQSADREKLIARASQAETDAKSANEVQAVNQVLTAQIAAAAEIAQRRELDLQQLRNELVATAGEKKKLSGELAAARNEAEQFQTRTKQGSTQLAATQAQFSAATQQLTQLKSALQAAQNASNDSVAKMGELQALASDGARSTKNLSNEITALRDKLEQERSARVAESNHTHQLEIEHDSLRRETASALATAKQLSNDLTAQTATAQLTAKQADQRAVEISAVTEKLRIAEKSASKTQDALDKICELQERNARLQSQLTTVQTRASQAETLAGESDVAQKRVQTLELTNAELTTEKNGLATKLIAANQQLTSDETKFVAAQTQSAGMAKEFRERQKLWEQTQVQFAADKAETARQIAVLQEKLSAAETAVTAQAGLRLQLADVQKRSNELQTSLEAAERTAALGKSNGQQIIALQEQLHSVESARAQLLAEKKDALEASVQAEKKLLESERVAAELPSVRKQVTEQFERITTLLSRLATAEAAAAKVKSSVEEVTALRTQIGILESARAELSAEKMAASHQVAELNQRLLAAERTASTAQAAADQIPALQSKIQELEKTSSFLLADKAADTNRGAELTKKLIAAELRSKAYETVRTELESLQQEKLATDGQLLAAESNAGKLQVSVAQIATLQSQNAALEQARAKVGAEKKALEENLARLNEQVANSRGTAQEIQSLKLQLSQVQQRNAETEKQLGEMEKKAVMTKENSDRMAALQAQLQSIDRDRAQLASEKQSVEEKLASVEKKLRDAELAATELVGERAQVGKLQNQLQAARIQLNAAEVVGEKVKSNEAQIATLRAQLQKAGDAQSQLADEKMAAEKSRSALAQKLAAAEGSAKSNQAAQLELVQVSAQLATARMQLERAQSEVAQAKRDRDQMAELRSQVQTLEQFHAAGVAEKQKEDEKYSALGEKLAAAETSANEAVELQSQVIALQGKLVSAESQASKNSLSGEKLATLAMQIESSEKARQQLDAENQTLRRQVANLPDFVTMQRERDEQIAAVKTEHGRQIQAAQENIRSAQIERENSQQEVSRLRSEKSELKLQLAASVERDALAVKSLAAVQTENIRLQTSAGSTRDEAKALRLQVADLEKTLNAERELLGRAQTAVETQTNAKLAEALQNARATTQALEETKTTVARMTAEKAKLEIELAEAERASGLAGQTELQHSPLHASETPRDAAATVNADRVKVQFAGANEARSALASSTISAPTIPATAATFTASKTVDSPATEKLERRSHTVVSGDTLTRISSLYYGTPNRWAEVYAANRDVIRDERALVIGRVLRIP